jgi:hypothetical protein
VWTCRNHCKAVSDGVNTCVYSEHVRRPHESQQLASLDDAIDIAEDGLWLLRLAIFDGDGDALPAKAADVGVGELGVVTADHLLNVRHLGVGAARSFRRFWLSQVD